MLNWMDFIDPNLYVFAIMIFAYLLFRCNQTLITAVAFLATVAFSHSFAYEDLDNFYIHISYAIILVPFITISNLRNATGLGLYALFQCFIAYDYNFYPSTVTIISNNYNLLHNLLDFCMIYLSIGNKQNVGDNNTNTRNLFNPLFDLFSIQKMEKIR